MSTGAAAGFIAAALAAAPASADVKIGTIYDYTGPFAAGGSKPAAIEQRCERGSRRRLAQHLLHLPDQAVSAPIRLQRHGAFLLWRAMPSVNPRANIDNRPRDPSPCVEGDRLRRE